MLASSPSSPDQGDPVSVTVARSVADAEGVSPLELEPLGSVVDTDALNRLVNSETSSGPAIRSIEFTYEGYGVTVHEDGHVEVGEPGA